MLAIKLKITGKKHQRSFRVIVKEGRSRVQGKCVEDLGWWNPHTDKAVLNTERAAYWMKSGAQPSQTVRQLLRKYKTPEAVVK